MVLTFSQINEAFTNLKPGNETNDNLEQFMAKESMSNFNDAGIEAFTNYQNNNKKPNYENLAHIVSEEQFVKSKKKAKKRRNNKKKPVLESANINNYQRLPSQEPSPLLENSMDFSSDEDEIEEAVTNESNETLELKKQMNELDTKLNMLINNLNKQSQDEEKKEEKAKIDVENSNIYDIILFVIFGLFILLLLESLTKLISKNIVKYEPSNSIKAVME